MSKFSFRQIITINFQGFHIFFLVQTDFLGLRLGEALKSPGNQADQTYLCTAAGNVGIMGLV